MFLLDDLFDIAFTCLPLQKATQILIAIVALIESSYLEYSLELLQIRTQVGLDAN